MSEGNSAGAATSAARRTEDIALDLMKFIAGVTHVGSKGPGGTGFGAQAAGKPDDQITQLLSLYGRCREAVESAPSSSTAKPAK